MVKTQQHLTHNIELLVSNLYHYFSIIFFCPHFAHLLSLLPGIQSLRCHRTATVIVEYIAVTGRDDDNKNKCKRAKTTCSLETLIHYFCPACYYFVIRSVFPFRAHLPPPLAVVGLANHRATNRCPFLSCVRWLIDAQVTAAGGVIGGVAADHLSATVFP